MKRSISILALLLAALGAFVLWRVALQKSVAAQERVASATALRESPFACDIGSLNPSERKRHDEMGPILRSLIKSSRELPDGFEFEFPSDQKTFQLVTEWSFHERMCCPFFDIDVRLDREGGSLWLRLTGREGTKDFIKVEGAQWLNR